MCEACAADPQTHSFDPICVKLMGTKSIHTFYTSSKTIKDCGNTESMFRHFDSVLSKIGKEPWGWIIDCKYISSKHVVHMKSWLSMMRRMSEGYALTIEYIYLVNAGPIIKTIIVAFTPFITKEFANCIIKVNGSPLELFEAFKKVGWTVQEVQPIIQRIQKDFE
jgi:hypothetical protein